MLLKAPCDGGSLAAMKAGLILLLGILYTGAAFAQGTVQFNNTATTQLRTNTTGLPWPGHSPNQTGLTTGAGQYIIGLFIAPAGTTDPNAFTLMGPTTLSQSGLGNGRFNGNPLPNNFVISNNTGQAIAFQVRAWSASMGSTWEAAYFASTPFVRGYLGVSTIGEVTPATGLTPTPALFGTGTGQVGGFLLTPWPVPEPSSAVLLLLGAAAGLGLWRGPFRKR
jgi:hypothetical protein